MGDLYNLLNHTNTEAKLWEICIISIITLTQKQSYGDLYNLYYHTNTEAKLWEICITS